MKQGDEEKLIQVYFQALLRRPDAAPPPGLEPETAQIIRQMVRAEQAAAHQAENSFEVANQRIRQRLFDQMAATVPSENQVRAVEVEPVQNWSEIGDNSRRTSRPEPRLTVWGRRAMLGGMAAVTLLVVGLVILIVLSASENLPNGPVVTIQPGARVTQVSVSPSPQAASSYTLALQSKDVKPNLNSLKKTAQVIEQRAQALGITAQSTVQGEQVINIQGKGAGDLKQLTDVLTAPGRVELILTNGQALKDGQLVQTTYCTKDSTIGKTAQCDTSQSKTGPPPTVPNKTVIFQTVLANDQPELTADSQADGDQAFLKVLDSMRSKLAANLSGQKSGVALVLDGQVLGLVQISNLFSTSGQLEFSADNSEAGKAELSRLKIMLKYGPLPLAVEVVKSSQP